MMALQSARMGVYSLDKASGVRIFDAQAGRMLGLAPDVISLPGE